MKDYAAVATQYARDVVDGAIPACRWVRLACERHLRDLARDAEGWRFTWNPELEQPEQRGPDGEVIRAARKYRPGDRACLFIELLPHIKDDFQQRASRGERIQLSPWQVFVVASIFGWVDRETGRRRFRTADVFVPRKNAKSTMAAGIGLYMLAVDGEFGAEVYSGATSEKQAGEVFKPALLMTQRSPEFRERFGVLPRSSNISIEATNSKFEPVIGKPGDGASPSCAIVDEYHEHPTEALYDTMKTGMMARPQPLLLVITTAGDNVSGPCFAHQEALQQVLEGVVEDERRFGIIYTIDQAQGREGDEDYQPGDDWTSEEAVIKANPNFGVSIDPETILADQRDAVRDARKQATFQTKHLNVWVQSSSPWLNLQKWRALGDRSLRMEDFAGEQCFDGMDLANVTDIASRCKVIPRFIDGELHYYAFWRHYLPEKVIADPENRHYQGWKREGWLIETSGSMIDQAQIEADLVKDAEICAPREVCIDAWGSPGISASLADKGFEVVRIPQLPSHLSAPMKFVDGLVKSGRIHHCGDPVATWGVSNVQVKPDRNDNWFPRRGSREKKIDPAIALLNAMARAMVAQPEGSIDEWLKSPIAA